MKIWYGYGSEHSTNLVMIGRFKTARDAKKAKEVIDQIIQQLNADVEAGLVSIGDQSQHFTDGMLSLLRKIKAHSVGPAELEQFGYEASVNLEGTQIIVKTEEIDVSAFLKVLIDHGARVEVYSAHDYPDTGYGRGL
jgi:Family of unknown function (DUF6375)